MKTKKVSTSIYDWKATQGLRISKPAANILPNNCPVIEKTADGISVGACCFYIGTEGYCRRHGMVRFRKGASDED